MLKKVFDRVCLLILIVDSWIASMRVKDCDNTAFVLGVGYPNTKLALLILIV
jgi:hypothetical protein